MTWERRHGLARRATAAHRRRLAATAASLLARLLLLSHIGTFVIGVASTIIST